MAKHKFFSLIFSAAILQLIVSCASTSSMLVEDSSDLDPVVAILTLDGPFGSQAAELLSLELAKKGVVVAERSERLNTISIDTDLSAAAPEKVKFLKSYGEELGVDYVFVGTTSADKGPLYSYAHVFMTLRLIDVNTGKTRWVGNYGNSFWSSAISTQGDLERGVRNLTKEFISSGASKILKD